MEDSSGRNLKVKKVQAYPFEINLEKGGVKTKGAALKLVQHGMLVDPKQAILLVGESISVEVVLPAQMGQFRADCKMIKTYDKIAVSETGSTQPRRIAEIHFLRHPLPEPGRQLVMDFLKEIKAFGKQS